MTVSQQIVQARKSSRVLGSMDSSDRDSLLVNIRDGIREKKTTILAANQRDVDCAMKNEIAAPLLGRLKVSEVKIEEMCTMVNSVRQQEDFIHKVIVDRELAPHLMLTKRYVPIGLIGMVFESRPDALVQMASLCLKSGNAVVLKGGREASETNKILYEIIANATSALIDGWIQLLETREEVDTLIKSKTGEGVDLIIPRGSNQFVSYIMTHANVPVLGHSEGICHMFVHKSANGEISKNVLYDAKTQYPVACNAVECLLIDANALTLLPQLLAPLVDAGVSIYCDKNASETLVSAHIAHTHTDEEIWGTEYSDMILAIRTVNDVHEAITHINTYGSKHTELIMTEEEAIARTFQDGVDAAVVLWNCSTRFSDGYRFGLGAEVGVSTSKIHARGPVGVEGLLSTQWLVEGKGQTVTSFLEGKETFTHKDRT